MHLSLSVPRVEGADLRPWVPLEHSLVISSAQSHAASSADAAKPGQDSSNVLDWDSASFLTLDMHTAAQMSVIKLQVGLSLKWLHLHWHCSNICTRYMSASGSPGLICKLISVPLLGQGNTQKRPGSILTGF